MPKNVKGGALGFFEHPFCCKIFLKMKGGGFFETLKNLRKKSHKAEITCTKNFGQGRDSNPSLCLADLKKSSKKVEAEEATLVWQLVEASL